MTGNDFSAPPPNLKIVPIDQIHPHEEHDHQRSIPLLERLRVASVLTNPPIVAPISDHEYVVLDGANRHKCFAKLGYKHLLVQVTPYEGGQVKLGVWQHVVSEWSAQSFLEELNALPLTNLRNGWDHHSVAQVLLRDGGVYSLHANADTLESRNESLRDIVRVYRHNAALSRTALSDPTHIWQLFPEAIALVLFQDYKPQDIIAAAQHRAFLPPGVSRHVVNGRVLRLNYSLEKMDNTDIPLNQKNDELQRWIQTKLANREVRYYAESTYQFDE